MLLNRTALSLTLLSAISAQVMAQEQVVKIGHVGPLSGQIAHLGKDNENGARMAFDALDAKGVTAPIRSRQRPQRRNWQMPRSMA